VEQTENPSLDHIRHIYLNQNLRNKQTIERIIEIQENKQPIQVKKIYLKHQTICLTKAAFAINQLSLK
jgi:hypothetical protein